MSGLKSRRKGLRNEYLIRDYFRSLGYTADRVPSSGAAEGFKGDVKVIDEEVGKSFLVEVKSRKDSFKSIYSIYHGHTVRFSAGGYYVSISHDFIELLARGCCYLTPMDWGISTRTINKIVNLQKVVGTCNYLVIKDDHKPPLFIEYRT